MGNMYNTAFDLTVIQNDNGWCLLHGDTPVMSASGQHRVVHKNKKFLTAMLEEFQSFGEVSIAENGALQPVFFSQYALFSDHLIADWKAIFIERLPDLLFSDLTFVENAGPERADQIAASSPIYDWLESLVGLHRNVAMTIANAVYNETYAMMLPEEVEDPDLYAHLPEDASGATFHTRSSIKETEFFKSIVEVLDRSTAEECTALHGLLSMNDHRHFLASVALVIGGVSKSQYATATMSSLNLRHGIQSDMSRDDHRSLYQSTLSEADIAVTFIELTKNTLFEIIRKGEAADTEFKESLSLDVRRLSFDKNYVKSKEPKIELAVLKTIVGFLNAKGGKLFIGVRDDASISGIEAELSALHNNSSDKFLLYLKDAIVNRIGKGMLGNLTTNIQEIDGKTVVVVDVKKASEPCFLKPDDDFYVRTSPATEQLKGKDLLDYIKNNF
jgi:hypothetical protein